MSKKKPYKSFFSAFPLPSVIVQPDDASGFRVMEVNDAFLALTGLETSAIIEKEIKQVFPENTARKDSNNKLLHNSLSEVFTSGEVRKLEALQFALPVNKNITKETYWTLENVPVPNAAGDVEYVMITLRETTEEVLLKKEDMNSRNEIIRLKEQHHHFISSNPDAMYSLDRNGNFLSANEGTCKLIEIPLEELLQMDFLPLCAPQDKDWIWNNFKKCIAGESIKMEAGFISGKGKKLVLSISLVPMVINGSIAGAYGIAKDLTDLRASEKIVIEKRKYLKVNAAFINALLEKDLEHETLQKAFANVGKTIGVDRTYYFTRHRDPATGKYRYSQKNEWSGPNVESQLHNPAMQNMEEELLREVVLTLKANQPFFANQQEITTQPVKDVFVEQNIKSMLLCPVFLENEFTGFVGFDDCTKERIWTQDEITFLRTLAHNLTTALERQRALQNARQQEENIIKTERKFKSLVQEASDVISILDCDGNFLFSSDNSQKILGFPPQSFIKRNAFEFIHPEDLERLKRELQRVEEDKQIHIPPFRFRDSKNNWRWLETTATNLLDDPAVEGIVTNSRDVTALVEQALEIEQINERYALAAKATEDLIYDWDLEKDEVVRFHESSREIFGYPATEVEKKEFWMKHIHPEDSEREHKKLHSYLKDPSIRFIKTEYRFEKADGGYAHVVDKGYVIRNQDGKAVRLIGATSDVSEIAEKEEALLLANTRFEMAMKATDEIIWDWDVKKDFVTRSEAFERNYGYKSGSTNSVNKFWHHKIIARDRNRVQKSLFSALKDPAREKWREEYCLEKANGEQAHFIDRGYIVRDKDGIATRVVGAILDVTESRRLIREIKKQNEGLREIAWKQSHEVRAPLARLIGLVQLLQSEDFEDLPREDIVNHILCSANELDQIVREIVAKSEKIEINHEKDETLSAHNSVPGNKI